MKQTLLFSFLVFITTIIIGPILLQIALTLIDPTVNNFAGSVDIILYTIFVGLIACIPSWLIIGLFANYLIKRNVSRIGIRALLSLIAIPVLILPVGFLSVNYLFKSNYWASILPLLASYYICLVTCIWAYRLPITASSNV